MIPFLKLPWLKKNAQKPVTVTVTVRLIDRPVDRLRLHEFRADEKLTSGMSQALLNQYVAVAVNVLRNEHPAWSVMSPDVPEHVRAAQQAKCEGYTMCLANLLAMGVHERIAADLVTDFSEEELDLPTKRK